MAGENEAASQDPVIPNSPSADPASSAPSPALPSAEGATSSATGAEAVSSPAPAAPSAEPTSQSPDWKSQKIDKLTGRVKGAYDLLRANGIDPVTGQKIAQPAAAQQGAASERTYTQAEVQQEARRIAGEELAAQQFTRACNETAQRGKSAYAETWDSRVGELRKLVNPQDVQSVVAYNSMLAMAMEIGNPEGILHELGGDLNQAEAVMSMHPTRMAVELAKLSMKSQRSAPAPAQNEPPQGAGAAPPARSSATRSSAPAPITPVGSRGSAVSEINPSDPSRADSLSIETWMNRRNAQAPGPIFKRRNER